jgi:hypothetical protein
VFLAYSRCSFVQPCLRPHSDGGGSHHILHPAVVRGVSTMHVRQHAEISHHHCPCLCTSCLSGLCALHVSKLCSITLAVAARAPPAELTTTCNSSAHFVSPLSILCKPRASDNACCLANCAATKLHLLRVQPLEGCCADSQQQPHQHGAHAYFLPELLARSRFTSLKACVQTTQQKTSTVNR